VSRKVCKNVKGKKMEEGGQVPSLGEWGGGGYQKSEVDILRAGKSKKKKRGRVFPKAMENVCQIKSSAGHEIANRRGRRGEKRKSFWPGQRERDPRKKRRL